MTETVTPTSISEKICNKCRILKPVSEFWKDRRRPDGLQPSCKPCHSAYKVERQAAKQERDGKLTALLELRPKGRPTEAGRKAMDEISVEVLRLHGTEGMKLKAIAGALSMPVDTVREYLARGRQLAFEPDHRELVRHYVMSVHRECIDGALDERNWAEARLAADALARDVGIVSTGGNTLNVGVGVSVSGDQVTAEVREFMSELKAEVAQRQLAAPIEGEVVEDREGQG